MATSDSEDFESADEDWEEGTDSVKEKLGQDSASIKPDLNSKTPAVDISKELPSGKNNGKDNNLNSKSLERNVNSQDTKSQTRAFLQESVKESPPEKNSEEVDENLISKSFERKVNIQDPKSQTRTFLQESVKEQEANENLKPMETLAQGDNSSLKINDEKTLSSDCLEDKIEQSETFAKGDHNPVVKSDSEKPLHSVCEDDKEMKLSKTHVKDDIEKLDVGKDDVKLKSKEPKTESNLETETPVLEGETDGWDCEDEDLVEDLIEESNNTVQMNAVLDKLSGSVEKEKQISDGGGSWGSWGSWGVTSLLSTATESVSTLTNQVSQGLSTVLETGLGVPDPEELAKQEIEEEKKLLESVKENSELNVEEKKEEESGSLFGFGRVISGVSSITKLVETASTKVVSGGLDTLETIGKKTMEVLQEGDPGLRKKRAIFSDKVVLSQILREAKDKAEQEDKAMQNTEEARKVHFETLFDDYHGLVHLEALEMLSKQCNIKLQSVLINTPPSDVGDIQDSIAEIKDLCQLPDEEDAEGASFETLEIKLADVGKGLGVPVANQKLVKTWQEIHLWLQECRNKLSSAKEETAEKTEISGPTAKEIHQKAIGSLARLTAEAVEQFHKTAELLLVYEKRNPCEEAKILLEMTSIFSLQVSTAATVFSENLNICSEYAEKTDIVNYHITNVFLEAANSSSYIQEAFQLLIPVLQVGAVLS